MKKRYFLVLGVASLILLTGCRNPIEDYEPYSTFDERMAEVARPPVTPDDQMPPMSAEEQYASKEYQPSGNDDYAADPHAEEGMRSFGMSDKSGSGGSSQSDIEVPFSQTRNAKHAANVGNL